MFIKFSDKTKKIMVKNSKKEYDDEDISSEGCIYLDETDSKDRRIKILNEDKNNKTEETEEKN